MAKERDSLRLDRKDMDSSINNPSGMGAYHYLHHSAKTSSYSTKILGAVPDDLGLSQSRVRYTHKYISHFRFACQSKL